MSSSRPVRVSSSRVVMLAAAALLGACGDDGGPALDAATDAPVPLDAANGQLWIRGNGITGASNKIVLAFVTGVGPAVGGICVAVTADPFSFVAAVKVPGGGDPCTLGAVASLPTRNYSITAGIYTPGHQIPDLCATTSVDVVNGSGDVTLPAFATCPPP